MIPIMNSSIISPTQISVTVTGREKGLLGDYEFILHSATESEILMYGKKAWFCHTYVCLEGTGRGISAESQGEPDELPEYCRGQWIERDLCG